MSPAPGLRSADGIRYVLSGDVLKRNLLIALAVGSLLSLTNQLDVILNRGFTARLVMKIVFNFLIPFCVSSASALLNRNCQ
jgi:hypothetical protein